MNYTIVLLIPLIPLAVFLLLGLFNQKIKPAVSGLIGVFGLVLTTLFSLYTAFPILFCHWKRFWGISKSGREIYLDELYRHPPH